MILPHFASRDESISYFRNLPKERQTDAFYSILRACRHIVFFGGAGVSTGSGLPDFRGKQGVYTQYDKEFAKYDSQQLLSHDCLVHTPELFFAFYRNKLFTKDIQPNRAHIKLAAMEKAGRLDGIITQNTDGLHHRAGSKTVYELHGTSRYCWCMGCSARFAREYAALYPGPVALCPHCGGIVRPAAVLFGEPIPKDAWNGARDLMEHADCLIVGGTSLRVRPASSLLYRFHGKHLIIINQDPTPFDDWADLIFREDICDVMDRIPI